MVAQGIPVSVAGLVITTQPSAISSMPGSAAASIASSAFSPICEGRAYLYTKHAHSARGETECRLKLFCISELGPPRHHFQHWRT